MYLVIGGCVLQASCCDYIIIIIRFGVWAGGGRARSLWGSGLRPSLGRAGGRRGGAGRPFQRSSPIENMHAHARRVRGRGSTCPLYCQHYTGGDPVVSGDSRRSVFG